MLGARSIRRARTPPECSGRWSPGSDSWGRRNSGPGRPNSGVTTASVIWVLAGLGSLIGVGHLGAAVALTIVTLVILVGVEKGETAWERRQGHRVSRELEGIEVE